MLSKEDLHQMARMCSFPQSPFVVFLRRLSHNRSKKCIQYNNRCYTVIYNTHSKRVTLLPSEEPLIGPPSPFKKRRRIDHDKHTKKRLLQRFNIEASDEDLKQMASMCSTKYCHIKLPFKSASQKEGRTRNLIHFKDRDMLAVYEPESDSIITAMPTEYMFKEEREWLYCSKRVRYKQLLKHTKALQ